MIKTAHEGYVTLTIPKSLFQMVRVVSVPTGKKRVRADGKIEAQFVCITKGSNEPLVWATKEQIVCEEPALKN